MVIAAADLSLSCLLDHAGNINVEDVTTELDLVSGHNLSVGQDAHGNKPSLGLRIKLFPVNSDNEVTTGRLSDSELEVDESNVNKNVAESQITPTKLSRDSKPDISSVATNPKKLKTSSHPAVIAQEFSTAENPAQHDATEYLTLPKTEAPVVSKAENEQDSPLKSQYLTPASSLPVSSNVTPVKSPEIKHSKAETKTFANRSEVAKHYKLSVDLSNVLMISKDYDNQDGILAYKVNKYCVFSILPVNYVKFHYLVYLSTIMFLHQCLNVMIDYQMVNIYPFSVLGSSQGSDSHGQFQNFIRTKLIGFEGILLVHFLCRRR